MALGGRGPGQGVLQLAWGGGRGEVGVASWTVEGSGAAWETAWIHCMLALTERGLGF